MPRKASNTAAGASGDATASKGATKPKPAARGRGKGKNATTRACKLAEVPANVFLEIAKRLQPLDLLQLARTCKTFRGALMKRSVRPVWTAAIQNAEDVPLPAVPDDMSEPAWIDLLLSRVCHGCLKKGVFSAFWEIRMRLCPPCRKGLRTGKAPYIDVYEHPHPLSKHFPELEFEAETAQMCVYKLIPVVSKELGDAEGQRIRWGALPYLEADFEELKRALSTASSVEERTTIVRERHAAMKARREQWWNCALWESQLRDARADKKEQTQISRRKAIVAKLREMGWGAQLDRMSFQERDGFLSLREVSQGGPLTDRVWSSIKAECIDYMEFVKSMHMEGPDQGDGIVGWDGADSMDKNHWMVKALANCGPLFY